MTIQERYDQVIGEIKKLGFDIETEYSNEDRTISFYRITFF